jgi:phosphoribosylaminoimidazole-succinocarboxamide synthase
MGLPEKKIKEGKAKILYEEDDNKIVMKFKDDLTALDGKKHDTMATKGKYNSVISATLLKEVDANGVPTHFIGLREPGVMEVKKVEIIPVEVVLRNIATGSMARRLPLEPGTELEEPVTEFYLKDDELHDPWLNDDHVMMLELATREEMDVMRELAGKVNVILSKFFKERGLILADFKLEFGRSDDELILADEITPDTMRLFDAQAFSEGRLVEYDKQVFRDGGTPADVKRAYDEAYEKIVGTEPDF